MSRPPLFSSRYFGEERIVASRARERRPFQRGDVPPRYARDRTADVRHIRLDLSFDFEAKKLMGRCTTTLAAINDGLDHVEFDAVELNIHRVGRGDAALPYAYDGRKLRVSLDPVCASGDEVVIVIDYDAQPRRGMYFIEPDDAFPDKPREIWTQGEDEDSRYWFPCYDYPNDKATSEIVASVPAQLRAVSNGKLIAEQADPLGKTKTYHWRQDVPHSAYLMTLCVGPYVEISESYDGIPIVYYVHPGREDDARRAFGNTPRMVQFFSEQIGVRYPYDKYAQVAVNDFVFGGMENTSATTQTAETLHDARAHLDFSSDPLVAHELAHQWWGDLLTCRDWAHGWLNEGFATYFETLWVEHDKGDAEFRYALHQEAHEYFEEDSKEYRRPIVCNTYREPIELFDRHLYQKGGLVLHMLRFVLGDALFWKAMHHYCEMFRGQNVITTDLQRAIEQATGKNLDWFFDQWVYKAGHPEFEVTYAWDDAAKLAHVTIHQKQHSGASDAVAGFSTPLFRMPVVIDFDCSGTRIEFRVEVASQEQGFHFPLPMRPRMVRVDPGNWILKTLQFNPGKDLLLYQLKHDDVMGRIFAAHALAAESDPQVIDALRETLLHDPFWGVQAEVAAALGNIRSSAALDALLVGLQLSHPKARRGAVKALGEFRDERAATALVAILERGDASYFVEGQAAAALGKTKSPQAYDALLRALDKPSYLETIRAQVFGGFGELKDARCIDVAKAWSSYGKPLRARVGAVLCLGRLGGAHLDRRDEVAEFLGTLTADRDFRVRLNLPEAFEALKSLDPVRPHLQRMVDQELDGRIRRRARIAIERLQEGRSHTEELKSLRDDLETLRDQNRQLRDRLDRVEATLKQ